MLKKIVSIFLFVFGLGINAEESLACHPDGTPFDAYFQDPDPKQVEINKSFNSSPARDESIRRLLE